MSTPTVTTGPLRRVPVQGRSVARVQRMLDACAELVDEVGYEGLTTTLLAERAEVAIGSVYQFFPDKRAIVQALRAGDLRGARIIVGGAPVNAEFATQIGADAFAADAGAAVDSRRLPRRLLPAN